MPFAQVPCPRCNEVVPLADSTPVNALLHCPKCGEHFHNPTASVGSNRENITPEVRLATLAPPFLASAAEDDTAALQTIRPPAPRSRTTLWVVLGLLVAGFVLVFLVGSVAVAVLLARSLAPAPPPASAAPPQAQGEQAVVWLTQGNRLMQQGDLDGAIDAFTQAIELNPRLVPAYCNRGLARSYKGDLDGGIADSTKAIELNPNDPFPFINRANARIQKGVDPDASIADATRALELRPGIPAALLNLGMARDQKGDYDGAIAEYDKALAVLPTFDKAYASRGQTRMRKRQWDKAEDDFTRALDLDFTHPEVYQNRGVCRMRQGNRAGAIEDFTEVLQLHPNSAGTLICRAGVYAWNGEEDKALADYAAALNLNPLNIGIHLLRGWFYLSMGQADKAAQDADAGLKLAGPKHTQAPYLAILAHCARRRQHPDQARRDAEAMSKQVQGNWPGPVLRYLHGDMSAEELLRAAADNDQRTEARAYVGVVLWLSGTADKAREHFQWVRDNGNPDFIERDLALWLLRRLEKAPAQKP